MLRFFDLRTEVRRTMILYDNVRARWRQVGDAVVAVAGTDTTPDNVERLEEAEHQVGIWRHGFGRSLTRNRQPALFYDGSALICGRLRQGL